MSAAQILLDDQQAFITTLQANSRTAEANAVIAINDARPSNVKYTPISPPHPYEMTDPPDAPTFDPIDLDLPPDPEPMGELMVISEPNSDDAPVFDGVAPVLDFGTQPNQLAEFHQTAPNVITDFDFPAVPAQLSQVFNAPSLIDRAAPDAPEVNLPDFTESAPVNDALAPTDVSATFRTAYADMSNTMLGSINGQMDAYLSKINPRYHEQMSAIETKLSTYLAGGTGLDATIEDAIYSRAREKNDVEAARVRDAAYSEAASRGFTLPTGALLGAVARARQEAANNNAKVSADIAIAQAELEQKNLQFAVTTSAALRATAVNAMLNYMQGATAINGMALDYAKGILGAVIQVYDLQVKSFSLKLDAYKAVASVYETRVRAVAQVVGIYQARIQALEALTNVDRAKIAIYQAQIDSLKAYGDLYSTQVEVVVKQASLEKLKIDLFQSQVQTYTAQVQAKSAEWQGYQARIGGEEAKSKVFTAQVSAFNSEVEAYKTKTEGISEQIKGQIVKNNAVLQEYTTRVNAYESNVKAKAAVANANIDGQRQVLTGYQGQISFAVAQANMAVEAYKANVEATSLNARTNMDMQVENVKSGLGQMKALGDVHGKILEIYSGPATAAAAGMNSLASINLQE